MVALPSEPLFNSLDKLNEVQLPTLNVDTWEFSGIEYNLETAKAGTYDTTDTRVGDSITFKIKIDDSDDLKDYANYLTMTVNGTDWAENPVVGYTFTENGEVMRHLFWIMYHLHLETLLYLIILS